MAGSAATLLFPTLAGRGVDASLAFQRSDVAAVVLGFAWLAIAVAAAGVSRAALAIAAAAGAAALVGQTALAGNPMLGDLARIFLFVPAGAAVAFALLRRAQAARTAADAPSQPRHADPEPAETPTVPEAAAAPTASPRAQFESDASELFGGGAQARARLEALPKALPTKQFDNPDEFERLQMMRLQANEAGYSERALELWRQLFQTFPDYYPALNSEARVLFNLNKLDEARERLRRSLEIAPDDETTLRLAARYAGQAGDWSSSAEHWRRVSEQVDLNANGLATYLRALTHAGQAEEARQLFRRHIETWPNDGRLLAAGAFAYERLGEFEEAYELWRGAMAAEPAAFSHRRRAIRNLVRLGRYKEATEMTVAYKVDAAEEPEALALADIVLATASKDAGPEAVEALSRLGGGGEAWAKLIERRLTDGDLVGAEKAFQAAVGADAGNADVLRAGAAVASRAGEAEAALERWNGVIDLEPDNLTALGDAASALAKAGAIEDAKKFLNAGLAIDAGDERLLRAKATIAAREQDWQTALDAWKEYGEAAGLDERVVSASAAALRGLGRLDEAEQLVAAGLVELGQGVELLIAHARCAEAREDGALALERWRRVTVSDATNAAGWRGFIRALIAADDVAGARTAVDRALAAAARPDDVRNAPHVRRLLANADGAKPAPTNR